MTRGMADTETDHRRATAERNLEAILDSAQELLARGAAASTTAVAAQAGVSRVTVYSHFPTRDALLEAVAERAVRRAAGAVEAARLEEGPPAEALERLIAVSWSELERNGAIAHAASEQLSPAALARAHEALREPIAGLIERGRAEGAFREDVPVQWMVSSYFALVHACGDEMRAGRLDAAAAPGVLQATLRSVFAG